MNLNNIDLANQTNISAAVFVEFKENDFSNDILFEFICISNCKSVEEFMNEFKEQFNLNLIKNASWIYDVHVKICKKSSVNFIDAAISAINYQVYKHLNNFIDSK